MQTSPRPWPQSPYNILSPRRSGGARYLPRPSYERSPGDGHKSTRADTHRTSRRRHRVERSYPQRPVRPRRLQATSLPIDGRHGERNPTTDASPFTMWLNESSISAPWHGISSIGVQNSTSTSTSSPTTQQSHLVPTFNRMVNNRSYSMDVQLSSLQNTGDAEADPKDTESEFKKKRKSFHAEHESSGKKTSGLRRA